ncbi:hypothetical protein JW935_22760 [candidate division KSB1 bacterium]|nr:hypothetical protein [candidate division KSB1 bacterium]
MKSSIHLYIFKTKLLGVRNYFLRYMDTRTIIEVLLFFIAITAFLLVHIHSDIAEKARRYGDMDSYLIQYMFFAWLFHFFLGVTFSMRKLYDPLISILMERPLPLSDIAVNRFVDLLMPVFFYLPFWLAVFFMFLVKSKTAFGVIVSGALAQLIYMLAATISGITLVVVVSERGKCPNRTGRILGLIPAFAVIAAVWWGLLFGKFDNLSVWGWGSLSVVGVFFYFMMQRSLLHQLTLYPERFIHPETRRRWSVKTNFAVFLLPVPSRFKTIVRKDMVYAFRSYKMYFIVFFVFLAFIFFRISHSGNMHDASQWLLTLSIIAAFVFSNLGFRFSQDKAENMRIIKSNPVSAGCLWWSKFWTCFLPCFWLLLAGSVYLFVRFGFSVKILVITILPAYLIAFTLFYVQNNFALYSYPYSKYAVFWYNLYIITAVLFFTVLLFPPLAVFFLVFGYSVIFRVLARIKKLEVF